MNMNKALAGVALAVLAGCGDAKKELHVYTWSDYIAPEVVSRFESKMNCRVIVDTFDSNEAMFAKLQAGSTGYDIIMPSSYQIPAMARAKMIQKLDKSKLPNVTKNFAKDYYACILDKDMTYNVPYAVTYTGVMYRKDKIKADDVKSWKVMENSQLKGRASLLSDMRETIGAALMYNGFSINATKQEELDKAVATILKWKENIAKFDNEQYKTAVASGEFFLGHGYSSDSIQVMMEDDNIGFDLPKEGFTIACDEMVLSATSKEPELAYAFIDFLYDAEIAKINMEEVYAPMPIAPALDALEPKLKALVCIDAATLKRGQVMRDFDNEPAVRAMYIKAWDKIKVEQ